MIVESPGLDRFEFVGIVFIAASGILGAMRNAIEEILLVDYDFPDGALLMAESYISAFLVSLVAIATVFSAGFEAFDRAIRDCADWGVAASLCLFLIASYGRDAGKLKVVKRSSAMFAKVLALVLPFGTWLICLLAYILSSGKIGESWENPSSWVRLIGFVVITVSSAMFFKRKN